MLRKFPQGSQAGDKPGSSSLSHSVLIRDHTPFPDELAGHSMEVKTEIQRSLSEDLFKPKPVHADFSVFR